jgi:hypothetical protein
MARSFVKKPSVGVVCVTYRNPEKPSVAREFGLVSLVEEMFAQDYDGRITLSIVDSSPNPHPYLEIVAEKYPDRLIYSHIPDRDQAPKISNNFIPHDSTLQNALALHVYRQNEMGIAVPLALVEAALSDNIRNVAEEKWDAIIGRGDDVTLASHDQVQSVFEKFSIKSLQRNKDVVFWENRLGEVKDFAGFVPFEEDYPIQANVFAQIFGDRPTIGMKKNYGVEALAKAHGRPDVIVFSDDDDHHAPDYVAKAVNALGDADFTRMTRYMTHIFNASNENKEHQWGNFDLRVRRDGNGYWRLDQTQNHETMHNLYPDGTVVDKTVGGKFSRLVTMAWPILGHEGALHTYSMNAWEKAVKSFGGCVPISFCEDMMLYTKLQNTFGQDFKVVHTPVVKGEESFIRIADGGNASVIEWTEKRTESSLPDWAKAAVAPLYEALPLSQSELRESLTERARRFTI